MKPEEEFVPYKHSKMMKELGFSADCLNKYEGTQGDRLVGVGEYCIHGINILAPLFQQAEEWLWGKHRIHVQVFKVHGSELFNFENRNTSFLDYPRYGSGFDSPVTAHREGILKAIEFLHEQIKK